MKKIWIAAGIIIIIIVLIGLNVWSQSGDNSGEKVETASLQEENIEETVIVPGKLKLADEQTIYFQGDKGEVEDVLVEEGDKVEEGDELIRYKNGELSNEQRQNELQMNGDYLELENIREQHKEIDKELEKDKDNEQLQSEHDDIELQEKQKNLEIEQAQLEKESIEQEIADMTVESDIDGVVVAIDEEEFSGAEQAEPQPMMQIGSLDTMMVKGEISEYDTLKVSKDQSVKLTSDAVPDKTWEGKIRFISDLPEQSDMEEDDSGAKYAVEATVEDKIPLKPGFEMLMEVETDKKKTDVLPLTAVAQDADTDYVYVLEGGAAKRKEVKTGTATNEVIEIKDGLDKKAEVILNPAGVSDGMEVDVQ